jgi:hypothetical protein
VVVGSAALGVRDIRASADIDILVTPSLWEKLVGLDIFTQQEKPSIGGGTYTCLEYKDIEIMCTHPYDSIDTQETIDEADIIDGVPIMSLEMLCVLKQQQGREKDMRDLQLVQAYLD